MPARSLRYAASPPSWSAGSKACRERSQPSGGTGSRTSALLVELIGSGWRGVERRLDRAERILDRIERALEERPGAALYRIDGAQAQ